MSDHVPDLRRRKDSKEQRQTSVGFKNTKFRRMPLIVDKFVGTYITAYRRDEYKGGRTCCSLRRIPQIEADSEPPNKPKNIHTLNQRVYYDYQNEK